MRSTDPVTFETALTHREKLFIDAYIASGGNGQQAAIAAGYNAARIGVARLHSIDPRAADPG
jgi:hypothetical protein